MNKLYLLLALGLSVNADLYAGDCLVSTSFLTSYGYLDFNCGTNCATLKTGHVLASSANYYSSYCADTDYVC